VIQRYSDDYGRIEADKDGDWVDWDDHQKVLQDIVKMLDRKILIFHEEFAKEGVSLAHRLRYKGQLDATKNIKNRLMNMNIIEKSEG